MAGPEKVNIDELMKIAKAMFESVDPAFKDISEEERNDIENIMKSRIQDVIQMNNSVGGTSTMSNTELADTMKALLPEEDEDEKSSGNDDQQNSEMDTSTSESSSESPSK